MDNQEILYVIVIFIAAAVFCFNIGCMVTETKNESMICSMLSKDDVTYQKCMNQSKEYIYAALMYRINVKEECK